MTFLPPPARLDTSLAIPFMLAAAALVAGTSLIAKVLGLGTPSAEGLHPLQVSAGRFVFALLTLLVVIALRPALRPSLRDAPWRWHLLRSVFGWLGVTAMFAAVALMPMAEATAISFLNPLVAMVLAVALMGEHLGARKLIAAGLALAGAVMILKPGVEAFQSAGLLALVAALFLGCEAAVIKRLSDREPALRVLLINNGIGSILSVIAASFVWAAPVAAQWGLLGAIGMVMVTAQACFIQSMKRGDASQVMPALYAVLVFAALYDFAFFGVIPDILAFAGGACIIGGALLLARR